MNRQTIVRETVRGSVVRDIYTRQDIASTIDAIEQACGATMSNAILGMQNTETANAFQDGMIMAFNALRTAFNLTS